MKFNKHHINRRAFLTAAGTAGVALPFLEGLPERSAFAQSENPTFGLFLCTACGVVQAWGSEPEHFWPTELGPLTKESMEADSAERCTGLLADHADQLTIVRGIEYPAPPSGCGHAQGLAQCLTARSTTGNGNQATSTGPSADTIIANAVNPQGVPPLTLYAGMKSGYIDEKLSFSSAGQVRAAEGNPYNVYQRLTGLLDAGGDTSSNMADLLVERRMSVNDLIREELNDLKRNSRLSQADRDRLDQHFTTIRDVETTMADMGATCSDARIDKTALEAMNSGQAFRQNGTIEEVSKLQSQLVALAFACDATRVATLQVGDGTDATRYTIDGETVERFHWISHRIRSDGASGEAIPKAVEWHTAIDRIRMNTFKSILDFWSEVRVPNGNLLDNGFLYWTSHIAVGPTHSFNNVPVIVAGNAGGFLKTGQYIDAGNVSNALLLNTLMSANGVFTEDFGEGGTGLINDMLA